MRVHLLFTTKITLVYVDLYFVCKRSAVECGIRIILKIIFSCSGFFFSQPNLLIKKNMEKLRNSI